MNFWDNIKSSKVAYAVEYTSLHSHFFYALTKSKMVSGELSLQHQQVENSIEKFVDHIAHKPISLIINTPKVLTRKVSQTENTSQILSNAFPNLVLDDFYYQIHTSPSPSKESFVSVVRKQYVHEVIQEFTNHKIIVTNFVIGCTNISGILKFLNGNEVHLLSHKINFNGAAITKIQPLEEAIEKTYIIENQEVKSSNLLGVSVLINQFLGNAYNGNIEAKNKQLKQTHSEKYFFKNALFYGIGALLTILLINAFIFNRKFSQIQSLQEEEQVFNNHKKQLQEKKKRIKNKEAIVQSILNTGFSKSSFYINQMIQILPKSILLEQFTYQPLSRSIKKKKKIELKQKTLKINGVSNNKEAFNYWLKQLEELSFVNNVIIEAYGITKGKNADFEIHLNIVEK